MTASEYEDITRQCRVAAEEYLRGTPTASLTAFHVAVPATLTYYVEAEDEDDAIARVVAAVAGSLIDHPHVWVLGDKTKLSPQAEWDVAHESECSGCGKPVGEYGRCCD